MSVFVANEQEHAVDETRLAALAGHVLKSENVDEAAELSVLLVSKGHMQRLNSRFADEDDATDVLAFPMMEDDDETGALLGDVVICPDVAQVNASTMNHSLAQELDVLIVHGILHLLGYDHQNEEERKQMDARLGALLGTFAVSPL